MIYLFNFFILVFLMNFVKEIGPNSDSNYNSMDDFYRIKNSIFSILWHCHYDFFSGNIRLLCVQKIDHCLVITHNHLTLIFDIWIDVIFKVIYFIDFFFFLFNYFQIRDLFIPFWEIIIFFFIFFYFFKLYFSGNFIIINSFCVLFK